MRSINYSKFRLLIVVLSLFALSCKYNKTKTEEKLPVADSTEDLYEKNGMPKYLNRLNIPEMELPLAGHFTSPNSMDTLDFDVKDSKEYLYDFSLFVKGDKKNALNITIASEAHFYDEGDLNGDGINEIGIIPGYTSSACRTYLVYTFKDHRWKLLYEISSHLGDRERGIDYVKREGDQIRILSANEDCCQCFGMDTTYKKIKN